MSEHNKDQKCQDDDVVRLGETITKLGKYELDIQKLEDQLRWRRETAQVLAIEITQLRQHLGLLCASTHEDQATEQASGNPNPLDTPCRRDREA